MISSTIMYIYIYQQNHFEYELTISFITKQLYNNHSFTKIPHYLYFKEKWVKSTCTTATVSSTNYILGHRFSRNEGSNFSAFYQDLPGVGMLCKFQNKRCILKITKWIGSFILNRFDWNHEWINKYIDVAQYVAVPLCVCVCRQFLLAPHCISELIRTGKKWFRTPPPHI